MNLFELFATLSLDTSDFDTGVNAAVSKTGEVKDAIDDIDTSTLSSEIAALDEDIADLDSEIERLDTEIAGLEADIDDMDDKALANQRVIEGVIEVGKELVKAGLEALVNFGVESLEAIENSGTAVGNVYKDAKASMQEVLAISQRGTGGFLGQAYASTMQMVESLVFWVDEQDRLNYRMEQLQNYKFANLEALRETLSGIFSDFEVYEPTATDTLTSVEAMTNGLKSQAAYWTSYGDLIKNLQERGVSASFLGQFADGSKESYDYLRAMGRASDAELKALVAAYDELESTRNDVASTVSDAQLSVDDTVTQLVDSIASLARDTASVDAAGNVTVLAQGMVNALATAYPSIAAQVDQINAKIAQLGMPPTLGAFLATPGNEITPGYTPPFGRAVGLDYVPYNEFPALLHEGEAVLTKSEANAWRKGSGEVYAGGTDPAALAAAVRSALADMVISMDGKTVGRMVSGEVSKQINRDAVARRYTK